MRASILVGLIISGSVVSGCVGRLETLPNRQQTDTLESALTGVTYALPKLQYEIKLARTLIECPGELALDGTPRLVDGQPTTLKFAIEATDAAAYVPGESYAVNYDKLPGFLRTATFEIKYWPSGNLKSIGAGAEDKSADVIRDTIKTGLSLASIVTGSPLSGGPPQTLTESVREHMVGCTAAAMALVTEAREIRAALKARATRIEKLGRDVERFQARAALRLRDPRDRADLISLFNAIDEEQGWVEAKTARLAEISEATGATQTIRWDSKPGSLTDQVWEYPLSAKQQQKFAALLEPVIALSSTGEEHLERRALVKQCFADPENSALLGQQKLGCVVQHLNLTAGIKIVSHIPTCVAASDPKNECISTVGPGATSRYQNARDNQADSGVFVREPARGRLLFCRSVVLGQIDGKLGPCTPEKDEGKIKEASFPQYGQLRFFPLRVGTFQAREMALNLMEDGRIESFSYKSTKAPGATLAAAAADAASQIDAALEKMESERRDDRKYAFDHANDAIQERINQLTKVAEEKKLLSPSAPANPLQPQIDQLATLQTEVAILELLQKKNDLVRLKGASPEQ